MVVEVLASIKVRQGHTIVFSTKHNLNPVINEAICVHLYIQTNMDIICKLTFIFVCNFRNNSLTMSENNLDVLWKCHSQLLDVAQFPTSTFSLIWIYAIWNSAQHCIWFSYEYSWFVFVLVYRCKKSELPVSLCKIVYMICYSYAMVGYFEHNISLFLSVW